MVDTKTRILVADADTSTRGIIRVAVTEEDWACEEAADGLAAIKQFRKRHCHLVILETALPELDGRVVCRQIRKTSDIPIIFISREQGEAERLAAFAVGGNDYVIKPFYPRELIARAKSLLSLHGVAPESTRMLEAGNLVIDMQAHSVHVDGREISLSPKEYDLLLFLCQNPSRAYSRDALLDCVWGEGFFGTDRTVDTHIKSLRGKIKPYQSYIVTIWGFGYKFEP